MLQIARFGAIAICNSNRESQIKTRESDKGACVCPPPRGGPWKPLLRVSVFGRLSASLRFVFAIVYGSMLWSCLVCSLSLSFLAWKRGRSGRTFSGVPVLFLHLECYCAARGGYLGGGASAPRYQGPLERFSREAGRPMGPSTPRCFSQSCVFVCVCSCVRVLELCLGNLQRSGALGLLSCFLSPLSFGPVSFLSAISRWGALSQRLLFLGRRGLGGLTDDRIYELCFCYFVFLFFFQRLLCPSWALPDGLALAQAG